MHICAKSNCSNRYSLGSADDNDNVSFVCLKCDKVYYNSPSVYFKVIKFLKVFSFFLLSSLVIYLVVSIQRSLKGKMPKESLIITGSSEKNDNTILKSWVDSKINTVNKLDNESKSEFQKSDLEILKLSLHALRNTTITPYDTIFYTKKIDSIGNHKNYIK